MSHPSYQALVERVMNDEAFAASLASHPSQALQAAGITPTPELLDALKGVDTGALRSLATAFREDQAASG